MGLSTSHNCYSGSCGSFNQWREWVANQIGFDLKTYGQGYCGDKPFVPWSLICHPFVPLFDHSDCEGQLDWKDCGPIARSLFEIIEKQVEGNSSVMSGENREYIEYMINLTTSFANGCEKAFLKKENVLFS